MKKILFLLLVTISSYGQTYQNPTFGTVTTKTNTEDNSALKVVVQDATGKLNWVLKNSIVPDNYSSIVYVNNANPNSATIFDLNNPPVTNDNGLKSNVNYLYIGSDASTWVYNSTSLTYVTKTITSATSNFYLEGTTTDAGNTKTGAITRPGTFSGMTLLTTNPVLSTSNKLGQNTGGNDNWRIYGESVVSDQGIMVLEVGDNGTPFASNGQKFEFRYSASNSGVAKTPFIIDYNSIISNANIGINTTNLKGALSVNTGTAMTSDMANQDDGAISFVNTVNTFASPTIASKSTTNIPLRIIGGANDLNVLGDMVFDVRQSTNADFTTLTTSGFKWTRASSNTLMELRRNGTLVLTTTPTTSAGTDYDLISRNKTTGVIEKVPTVLASGNYTPTLTNTSNVTSSSFQEATYTRVGNIVTARVALNVTPTATTTITQMVLTLPINRTVTTGLSVGSGTATASNLLAPCFVQTQANNNQVLCSFTSVNTSQHSVVITFQYSI